MTPPKTDDLRQLVEEADQLEGLGDVVAKATKKLGIKECDGCKKRREWLNKRVPFKRRKR